MTAEIAIMNRNAVALAADSAVTITWGNGSKVYNGAEKLFALTKHHPVGVMVFGTGDLCRVSWELIVKQYRKRLGDKSFDSLDEYAIDFLSFIEHQDEGTPPLIPDDLKNESLKSMFHEVLKIIIGVVEKRIFSLHRNGIPITQDVTHDIFSDELNKLNEMFSNAAYLQGFSLESESEVRDLTHFLTEQVLVDEYGENNPLPPNVIDQLKLLFKVMACKQIPIGVDTGLVIAGYGEKEYFPSVLCYSVKGFVSNRLRYCATSEKSMSSGNCTLQAYAQDEEVLTFMQGVSPKLYEDIQSEYLNVFVKCHENIKQLVADKFGENTDGYKDKMAVLDNEIQNAWASAIHNIQIKMSVEYEEKIKQMIEFLPKEDLAYMAESLVNMTAFKRKVSNESESVGGPIDVALISKGDGFIWVKRKHYFKKKLNSHYFKRA